MYKSFWQLYIYDIIMSKKVNIQRDVESRDEINSITPVIKIEILPQESEKNDKSEVVQESETNQSDGQQDSSKKNRKTKGNS